MNKNNEKKLWIKIGLRITEILAQKGITQKSLADHIRIKPNVISYWCKGERTPNTEQIIMIADYFGVSTDYLLCRTDVASTNTDIQMICDYTGLSEKAIQIVANCKMNGDDIAIIACKGKISHTVTFSKVD